MAGVKWGPRGVGELLDLLDQPPVQERVEVDLRDADYPAISVRSSDRVPFLDLSAAHEPLKEEILRSWEQLLGRGAFIGGEEVDAFERDFAEYVGSAEAIGVGSGTDALVLALHGMGVETGDEVITVPHTFSATVQAIVRVGARPVFVDVDPITGTMDPEQAGAHITRRTRVVLPVHLYGQSAELAPILQFAEHHGLGVLEDACQAHGAEYRGQRVGSIGTAAAFSFYPGKNLGACGDAGMITTNDRQLAAHLRKLRNHGQSQKNQHEVVGFNSRLDALQAAALRIKLRHLESWIVARRHWAARYSEALTGLSLEPPVEARGRRHVYHLYVVRHRERTLLRRVLEAAGVETGLHYPVPAHLQPAFRDLGLESGAFPHAERWAREGFSLPIFPELTDSAVDRVCSVLSDAVERTDVLA
jgi:dTDP-4-amino-4,6-dideoxygalactose transaminase